MIKTRIHSALAWALIVAQLLVVGLSQGQMVICHKANGSSHIELVGEYVTEAVRAGVCELPDATSPQAKLSSCSDAPCVDELLSVGYTIVRVRDIEHGHALGVVHVGSLAAMPWTLPAAEVESVVVASRSTDGLLLIDQQVRIRSTVLNL